MMKYSSYILVIILAFVTAIGCTKTIIVSVEDYPLSNSANSNAIGASAKELLSVTKSKLLVEIQYMPGYRLEPQTITNLTNFLRNHINKQGGIVIVQKEIPETGAEIKSPTDIAQVEQQHRTAFNTDDQVAVNVLITNGYYKDRKVLGLAFRNTSICMFGKIIKERSEGIQISKVKIESTVLMHEFGHLFGLVDLGSPMQTNHRDVDHGNHCDKLTCIMNYGIETSDVLSLLQNVSIPSFDTNCRNDLRANGGK